MRPRVRARQRIGGSFQTSGSWRTWLVTAPRRRREHLRRLANEGALGEGVVAIGPWWNDDSQQEIDAVVLAQRELTRVPVLVGESKWAHRVDAVRIKSGLIRKAAALTPHVDELSYVVCARDAVDHPDIRTRTVTAADIFAA